jgi:hypothetical protein
MDARGRQRQPRDLLSLEYQLYILEPQDRQDSLLENSALVIDSTTALWCGKRIGERIKHTTDLIPVGIHGSKETRSLRLWGLYWHPAVVVLLNVPQPSSQAYDLNVSSSKAKPAERARQAPYVWAVRPHQVGPSLPSSRKFA